MLIASKARWMKSLHAPYVPACWRIRCRFDNNNKNLNLVLRYLRVSITFTVGGHVRACLLSGLHQRVANTPAHVSSWSQCTNHGQFTHSASHIAQLIIQVSLVHTLAHMVTNDSTSLRLSITCDNAPYGCTAVLKLDVFNSHVEECVHNPKRPFPCDKGCGFDIPKDELKDHNCVRQLRVLIGKQTEQIDQLKTELTDQQLTINELKRELQLFKDFMRAMRVSNPAMRAIADQMERDEVVRWSSALSRARVTRWGGMISTPDDALQVSLPPKLLMLKYSHESSSECS